MVVDKRGRLNLHGEGPKAICLSNDKAAFVPSPCRTSQFE